MSLGEHIKTLRKQGGLTQKQLASKLGVSEITIRQYEGNKRQPRIEQLGKIAEVLGVPTDYLIDKPPSIADMFNGEVPGFNPGKRYKDIDGFWALIYKLGFALVDLSDGEHTITDLRENKTYSISENQYQELQSNIESYTRFQIHQLIDQSAQL